MRVLITGAAGMIGRKLTERLVKDGRLAGRPITALDLSDVAPPTAPQVPGIKARPRPGDISMPGFVEELIEKKPGVVFHLAGIVSGESESNFELGYRVNLDGTRALFDAIRLSGHNPRVVFTSSIAVFGAPFPEVIHDDFQQVPLLNKTSKRSNKGHSPPMHGCSRWGSAIHRPIEATDARHGFSLTAQPGHAGRVWAHRQER